MPATVSFAQQPRILSDPIDSLPTDQTLPSHSEVQIVDALFKQKQSTMNKILSETKDVLFVGFLFIIFSLPQLDDLIRKLVPSASTSPYILLLIKTLAFMGIYFLVKNLYLVRKNTHA